MPIDDITQSVSTIGCARRPTAMAMRERNSAWSDNQRFRMPVAIACPKCGRPLSVPSKKVGQTIPCPSCGELFIAESSGAARSATVLRPPPPPRARDRGNPADKGYSPSTVTSAPPPTPHVGPPRPNSAATPPPLSINSANSQNRTATAVSSSEAVARNVWVKRSLPALAALMMLLALASTVLRSGDRPPAKPAGPNGAPIADIPKPVIDLTAVGFAATTNSSRRLSEDFFPFVIGSVRYYCTDIQTPEGVATGRLRHFG